MTDIVQEKSEEKKWNGISIRGKVIKWNLEKELDVKIEVKREE